ncbi:MAG: beta-ketoacyl synthase N-terminal-like domain-containing protein [Verrucomicrobiota bacterium]
MNNNTSQTTGLEIAVIGMAGRFPGAPNIEAFWKNLVHNKESITDLSNEYLKEQGVSEKDLSDPNYIKRGGILEEPDYFDHQFFNYSPKEAEILDPQQRLFLECCWQALENAGYDSNRESRPIGVFAGAGMNTYLLNLYTNSEIHHSTTPYEMFVSNDKDFLATRVSYKLNLRGPSMSIQTACSSSLVAIHTACQSLLSGECDFALAGGISLSKQIGYRAQQGSIHSPDGHCRAFDAKAKGTVGGNGVGVVVLKRLEDAIQDKDNIQAIIKGSAVTNDGANKVSYTAPQIESQSAAISNALASAEVPADTITYLEAHGTGTSMGDPIEIEALTQAYRLQTDQKQFCSIGSVKTNIGHLDAAAGVAGFIKTVLSLKHNKIPASLHYKESNPEIDFTNSPFFVNNSLREWTNDNLKRAGISSFGIGGTNCHMILEEAPNKILSDSSNDQLDKTFLLPVSAKSESALKQAKTNLADFLKKNDNLELEEIAYTLQEGRRAFAYRDCVHSNCNSDALKKLNSSVDPTIALDNPSLVLIFPGQGTPLGGFSESLKEHSIYQNAKKKCQSIAESLCSTDLGEIEQECLALFIQQYALSQLILHFGAKPTALLGHSFGEITAACIAGTFSLESAIKLTIRRSQLMDSATPGAMLAIASTPDKIKALLNEQVILSAHNAPTWINVSGPIDSIESFSLKLKEKSVPFRKLKSKGAFHTRFMQPAATALLNELQNFEFNSLRIPIVSSKTGEWLTDEEVTSPHYWANQLIEPVNFNKAASQILEYKEPLFLELSSTATSINFIFQQKKSYKISLDSTTTPPALAASLWEAGVVIDWTSIRQNTQSSYRIELPSYPFERQRFFIPPQLNLYSALSSKQIHTDFHQGDTRIYVPSWKRVPLKKFDTQPGKRQRWLIFASENKLSNSIPSLLESSGDDVFVVQKGDQFASTGFRRFILNPNDKQSFSKLLNELSERETFPQQVVYFWSETHALKDLSIALAESIKALIQLHLITEGAENVLGNEVHRPNDSSIRALGLVIGQEFPLLGCRTIDITADQYSSHLVNTLVHQLRQKKLAHCIALRGKAQFELTYESFEAIDSESILEENKTYFIAGDFTSELGQIWSRNLCASSHTKVVLLNTNPELELMQRWTKQAQLATTTSLASFDESWEAAIQEHGSPYGVFLCTPTTNEKSASPIALLSESHWKYNRFVKRDLFQTIAPLIENSQPSFVCVQTSMSSVLGGIGLGAYASANDELDRWVAFKNQTSKIPWISINWDRIEDESSIEDTSQAFAADHVNTMSQNEAWKLTQTILDQRIAGTFIATTSPLASRLAQWVQPEPQAKDHAGAGKTSHHKRPDLPNKYVAPRDEVEKTIVTIWEEFLGVRGIGVEDNFFALGGHSLLAIQIIGKLRQSFPVEIELRHLVSDNPTPASIAAVLKEDLPANDQLDDMAKLLEEIEQLTPEEAKAQIQEKD